MDDAVHNGVADRRIGDEFVPAVHGDLAGDQQRTLLVAVLDDLQQVVPLLGGQRFRTPVVKDEQRAPSAAASWLADLATGHGEFAEQAWHALIQDREAFPACFVAERAGEPRLPGAARASEILPKISNLTFRSAIRIILGSVSV